MDGRFLKVENLDLEKLAEFSRNQVANHPGLFHPSDFPLELFCKMSDSGLLGAANLATAARGCYAIASQTGSLGFSIAWAHQSIVPLALQRYASLPQYVMDGVRTGETILSLAISEPNAGAHPKYLSTTAVRSGGGWILDGEKTFVTNGPIASHVAVLAITGVSNGRKEFSLFLIPTHTVGFNQVDHPQLDYLRPAQHCGFRLERCQTPENALIGRIGKAYEDVAIPFRDLEDAVHLGGLIGVLDQGARSTMKASGPEIEDEFAVALGELAGISTAMQAVYLSVLEALETWDLGSDELSLGILSIHDLARRYVEVLGEICDTSDEYTQRILRDIDRYLDMARKARGRRKSRLGSSYFINEKAIFGKHLE